MTSKIDVRNSFDTLDWHYLIKVLVQIGFDKKYYDVILTILH